VLHAGNTEQGPSILRPTWAKVGDPILKTKELWVWLKPSELKALSLISKTRKIEEDAVRLFA
jgi:hypothetical protein